MFKWGLTILLATWAWAAPAPLLAPSEEQQRSLDIQQFLVLNPQDIFPEETALKYRQPLITPLNQLGYVTTPKEQFYFYYPSVPFTQRPLISFKQPEEHQKYLQPYNFFVNFLPPNAQRFPPFYPAAPPSSFVKTEISQPEQKIEEKKPEEADKKMVEKLESFAPNPEAEAIPQTPFIPAPQAPIVPPINDQRVYILSGQPQFFGNFDAFADPLNPLFSLQPLAAIHPRSNDRVENNAEGEQLAEGEVAQQIPAELKVSEIVAQEEQAPLAELAAEEVQQQPQQIDLAERSSSDVHAEENDKTEPKEDVVEGKSAIAGK